MSPRTNIVKQTADKDESREKLSSSSHARETDNNQRCLPVIGAPGLQEAVVDSSPAMVTQREHIQGLFEEQGAPGLQEAVDSSPAMVTQREHIQGLFEEQGAPGLQGAVDSSPAMVTQRKHIQGLFEERGHQKEPIDSGHGTERSAVGDEVVQRSLATKLLSFGTAVVVPPLAFHLLTVGEYRNTQALYDGVIAQSKANISGANLQLQYAEKAKRLEKAKVWLAGFASWTALAAVALAVLSFPFAWLAIPSAICGVIAGLAQVGVGGIEKVILGCDQKLKGMLGSTDFYDAMVAKVQKEKYTWWINIIGGLVGAGAGGAGFGGLSVAVSGGLLGGERAVAAGVEVGSSYGEEAAAVEVRRRKAEQVGLEQATEKGEKERKDAIYHPKEGSKLANILTAQKKARKPPGLPAIQRQGDHESTPSSETSGGASSQASDIIDDIRRQASAEVASSIASTSALERIKQAMLDVKGYLTDLRSSKSKLEGEVTSGSAKLDGSRDALDKGLSRESTAAENRAGSDSKGTSKEEETAAFESKSTSVDRASTEIKGVQDRLEVEGPELEEATTGGILSKARAFFGKTWTSFRTFMSSAWSGLVGRIKRFGSAASSVVAGVKARIVSFVLSLVGVDEDLDAMESDVNEGVEMAESGIEAQEQSQETLKKIS